jgi:hypothetical protein
MIMPAREAASENVGEKVAADALADGRRLGDFREAEVEHFDRAVRTEFDVRRLQVAVNDAELVCGFECFRDLRAD